MTTRSFQVDKAAMNNLLRGRSGEVGRMMAGFAGLSTSACKEVSRERVKRHTGKYENSIRSTMDSGAGGIRVRTEATAPYAGILEHGSRPHVILPRRAKVLRFTVGGQVVFARKVNHPGTKPYNILRDGVARAGRQLHRLARR